MTYKTAILVGYEQSFAFQMKLCPMTARLNNQLSTDLNVKLDWITIMAFNLI